MSGYEGETIIKGHRPAHGTSIVSLAVASDLRSFLVEQSGADIRDILIENIGSSDVYLILSKAPITNLEYPPVGGGQYTSFDDVPANTGWTLRAGRFMSIDYLDFAYIGYKTALGDTSTIQLAAITYQ